MNPPSEQSRATSKPVIPHSDYLINLTKQLADGKRAGVFATVDEHGMPHLRWMATLSLNNWPVLYTITSPDSHKMKHIRNNPNVSWMFSNEEMSIIVNIRGKARVVSDAGEMQRVWKLLEDKSRAYFLSIAVDSPGFAVIETAIEDIDATMPKYDIKFQTNSVDLDQK